MTGGEHSLAAAGARGPGLLAWLHPSPTRYLVPAMTIPRPSAFAGRSKVAVLDTGVLPDHPWIAPRLQQPARDVTGLGSTDEHGHGTIVALLLIAAAPDIELISVRVLDGDGGGPFTALLLGMQEALAAGADLLNISLGRYDPECRGDCLLCQAASNVAAAGAVVIAAAGNVPGQTDCPAKAGLFRDRAIAVSAWDSEAQSVAWYSGVGTAVAENAAAAFSYRWEYVDVDTP